jgi:hypothetical protein
MKTKGSFTPKLLTAFLLLLLLTSFGCWGSDDDDDDDNDDFGDPPVDDDDDNNDVTSVGGVEENLPAFFHDRPELTDWSLWRASHDQKNETPFRQLGAFGIGNGRVFALVGARKPFTTLHNIAGPYYQKRIRFFSDKQFTLLSTEAPVAWDKQRAYRIRGSAISLTHSSKDYLSLWTVDYAPRGKTADGGAAGNTLHRTLIIHNRSDQTMTGLKLTAATTYGSVQAGLITEVNTSASRYLAAGFPDETVEKAKSGKALIVDLPVIEPDGEVVVEFILAFSQDTDATSEYQQAGTLDPDQLLTETLTAWKENTLLGAQIETSDVRFNDLIEGLAQTMKVQQAVGGCFAQMSEYGYNALRDMYGIARFYPLIGRSAEYKQMLDYVWQAALHNGDIRADVEIDLDFDPTQTEPDWENLPTFAGRMKAESPSYLILMYKEYLNATGDWTLLAQRYGMLRHALIHQDFRHSCLLPFSDDETFRIAMMASFGHSLFEGYEDQFLSANSSFLFVVAAEFMEELAEHLDFGDDAAEYHDLATEVRDCTEQYYWMEDGYFSPILDIDTLEPDPRPFEDVNTKPLWLGYHDSTDPAAKSNVLSLIDLIAEKDGLYFSPLAVIYTGLGNLLGASEGIVTGMAPGFQLDNLARLDHPAAADSFMLQDRFFHDSGNVSEAHSVDDYGRITYLYEPYGLLCDLTARYRSWEGAINAAAAIQYLFGLELDATNERIAIAPHLPKGWEFAEMKGARLADRTFDIRVTDDGAVRRVVLDDATGSFLVDATVSVEGSIKSIEVNGEPVETPIDNEWGRSRVSFTDLAVSPQQTLIIEVSR